MSSRIACATVSSFISIILQRFFDQHFLFSVSQYEPARTFSWWALDSAVLVP
jgi:hypothetical protein